MSPGFAPRAALTTLLAANFVLLAITVAGFVASDAGYDWAIYVEAGRRVFAGDLYQWGGQYAWSYSPLLAYLFAVLAPLGYLGWSALHFAALGPLRDWRLTGITLASWPFWADVYNGNTMTFVFVAAVGAIRGSAVATVSYLSLFLLMPRPIMLPVVAWVLWKRPAWRTRFLALAATALVLVLLTGYGPAWAAALVGVSEAVAVSSRDIGPGVLLGRAWIVVGAVLAIVLVLRGRIGLATLAASPYWLPQYLLMVLLELVTRDPPRRPVVERARSSPAAAHDGASEA